MSLTLETPMNLNLNDENLIKTIHHVKETDELFQKILNEQMHTICLVWSKHCKFCFYF